MSNGGQPELVKVMEQQIELARLAGELVATAEILRTANFSTDSSLIDLSNEASGLQMLSPRRRDSAIEALQRVIECLRRN